MIPVEGLELVNLSLLLPSFLFLCVLPHLTFYMTSFSFPTSWMLKIYRGRGEGGAVMKINLNCSCAKSPRLTRSWVAYNQPSFQENKCHCPVFLSWNCIIRLWPDGFQKSRWAYALESLGFDFQSRARIWVAGLIPSPSPGWGECGRQPIDTSVTLMFLSPPPFDSI